MKITWLGHSCFVLESNGYKIVLDPFEQVRGMTDTHTSAQAVFCSHEHFDHAFRKGVQLEAGPACPFAVHETASWHDNCEGKLRGSNIIRSFTAEGLTVVHLGDLGCPLTPEQIASIGPCDALLLPIGGTFTLDPAGAKKAAEALKAPVIIPMHYRQDEKGFEELCTAEDFTGLFQPQQVKHYAVSCFELTPDTPSQVAVLKMP